MDKYISVPLEMMSIPAFYETCGRILNADEDAHYDCRKIEVSEERFNILQSYEMSRGCSKFDFNMLWVFAGPKCNNDLHGEVVRIQDGFIS